MKTQMVKTGLMITALLVGCAQQKGGLNDYQTQSRELLQSMAQRVSTTFSGSQSMGRGVASTSSFNPGSSVPSILGGTLPVGSQYPLVGGTIPSSPLVGGGFQSSYPLVGGGLLNPDSTSDAAQCLAQVQAIPQQAQYYVMMVAALSRCLNRLLVNANPLMSYGYRNMDSTAQNNYAYLLNWRQFGCTDQFGQNQFQVLNPLAGNGFYPPAATYNPAGSSACPQPANTFCSGSSTGYCPGPMTGACSGSSYPGLYGYGSSFQGNSGGYGTPLAQVPGFTLSH